MVTDITEPVAALYFSHLFQEVEVQIGVAAAGVEASAEVVDLAVLVAAVAAVLAAAALGEAGNLRRGDLATW